MPAVATYLLNNAMALHDCKQKYCAICPDERAVVQQVELQEGQVLTNTRTPPIMRWALLPLIEDMLNHTLHLIKKQLSVPGPKRHFVRSSA